MSCESRCDKCWSHGHERRKAIGWRNPRSGDNIAEIGRGWEISGYKFDVDVGLSEHPVNPAGAAFGANIFSSERAIVDGEQLLASTWHSAAPQAGAEVTGIESNNWGYLDAGTTPLYNSAIASIGADPTRMAKP